jgi:hypothetical protein
MMPQGRPAYVFGMDSLAFHPTGKLLATGTNDGTISCDGKLYAAMSRAGEVRLWQLPAAFQAMAK